MNPVKLITPSNLDAVTLDEAKAHLKVTGTAEDTMIQMYLNAAVQRVENYRQSNIMSSTYELYARQFRHNINLQKHPVTEIHWVKYYDEDNNLQTVDPANYRLHDFRVPCRVEFDAGYSFPDVYDREYPIVINYQAGFTLAASSSLQYQSIKHVICNTLGTYNELKQMEMVGIGIAGVQLKEVGMNILDAESMWL